MMTLALPVTSVLVAAACLGLVALSLPIPFRRMKLRTAMGDGGDEMLGRMVRAQANFIEYVPLALIGIGLVELAGMPKSVVWTLGGVLALARVLHAVGLMRMSTAIRGPGLILTFAVLVSCAGILIARVTA